MAWAGAVFLDALLLAAAGGTRHHVLMELGRVDGEDEDDEPVDVEMLKEAARQGDELARWALSVGPTKGEDDAGAIEG